MKGSSRSWRRTSVSLAQPTIASFQHGVLESSLTWMSPEASLQTWMPAIHAGMTKIWYSLSALKIMNHFVMDIVHRYPRSAQIFLARVKFQQLPRVIFENRLLLGVRTRQRFDFIDTHPIAEHVRKISSQQQMFTTDLASQKIERLHVVN